MSDITSKAGLGLGSYVASSVKEYREKNNLTLTQFAIKADLSVERVVRIENETYELRVTDLMRIAVAIEVQASQLLRAVGL